MKEFRWSHKEYNIEGSDLLNYMNSGLAKHQSIPVFKQRKSYPLYSADYEDHEGIYFFGGSNENDEENYLIQMKFDKYTPVLKRVNYTGTAPSHVDPLLERYSDNIILIVSGDQYNR